jgi:predicted acyltransferase
VVGLKALAFPLIVIGMNSITAYCSDWLFLSFIQGSLRTHLGAEFFKRFGAAYEQFFRGWVVLLVLWLMLLWMYRKKIFLRI